MALILKFEYRGAPFFIEADDLERFKMRYNSQFGKLLNSVEKLLNRKRVTTDYINDLGYYENWWQARNATDSVTKEPYQALYVRKHQLRKRLEVYSDREAKQAFKLIDSMLMNKLKPDKAHFELLNGLLTKLFLPPVQQCNIPQPNQYKAPSQTVPLT